MFLMSDKGVYSAETDGRQCCYQVIGNDGKCYGTFLKAGQAMHYKQKLEESVANDPVFQQKYNPSWEILTYSIGPSCFFADYMDDYEEPA